MCKSVRSSYGAKCLLALILAVFLPCLSASALTVIVTSSKLSRFSQPNRNLRYACYQKTSYQVKTGTINTKRLQVGTRWVEITAAQVDRSISALKRKIAKTKNKSQKKTLSKQLRTLTSQRVAVVRATSSCAALILPTPTPTIAGPEFLGHAQSLEPYHEQLTDNEINHLLNKVAFGGSETLRTIGKTQGLTALVNALVDGTGISQTEGTLQNNADFWAGTELYYNDEHPANPIWTAGAAETGQTYRFFFSEHPLKEWMILFWSSHFAVNLNRIDFSYSQYGHRGIPQFWALIREESLGNFRDLAHAMVTDSAMCAWLNNDDNRADSPNQNFAREFMELFTLGAVDPITGAANYTEEGIAAATGYFSGFYEDSAVSPQSGLEERVVRYDDALHDTASRTVFRNIQGAQFTGAMDWQQFPDYVLDHHPAASRYIVERLFAEMVTPDVSESVVASLAAELKGNNYEVKPTLRRILKSEAMFAQEVRNVCISSPLEIFTRLSRRLLKAEPSRASEQLDSSRWFFQSVAYRTGAAGQIIFEPPSVFAWKGSCGLNRSGTHAYGEGWITAQSILNRFRGCTDLMNSFADQQFNFKSILPAQISEPGAIAQNLARRFFDLDLTPEEIADLTYFMTHDKDPAAPGGYTAINVDLNEDYYINRKIPRVLCLLFDLEVSNEK